MSGISWRAKKLQFALSNNSKLINPKLSKERRKQLLELLVETAEVLATKIEDLKRPCNVPPLEEFRMNIVHKAGSTLQNADGLSRCAFKGDSKAD